MQLPSLFHNRNKPQPKQDLQEQHDAAWLAFTLAETALKEAGTDTRPEAVAMYNAALRDVISTRYQLAGDHYKGMS